MMQDVNTGIAWVLRHAPAFGGDGQSYHIVGQSVSRCAAAVLCGVGSPGESVLASSGSWA